MYNYNSVWVIKNYLQGNIFNLILAILIMYTCYVHLGHLPVYIFPLFESMKQILPNTAINLDRLHSRNPVVQCYLNFLWWIGWCLRTASQILTVTYLQSFAKFCLISNGITQPETITENGRIWNDVNLIHQCACCLYGFWSCNIIFNAKYVQRTPVACYHTALV